MPEESFTWCKADPSTGWTYELRYNDIVINRYAESVDIQKIVADLNTGDKVQNLIMYAKRYNMRFVK